MKHAPGAIFLLNKNPGIRRCEMDGGAIISNESPFADVLKKKKLIFSLKVQQKG